LQILFIFIDNSVFNGFNARIQVDENYAALGGSQEENCIVFREACSSDFLIFESDGGDTGLVKTIFEDREGESSDYNDESGALATFIDVNCVDLYALRVLFSSPNGGWLLRDIFKVPESHSVVRHSTKLIILVIKNDL
jgi:hypothetical protein